MNVVILVWLIHYDSYVNDFKLLVMESEDNEVKGHSKMEDADNSQGELYD